MLDGFGSLGIDNRPRIAFVLFLLASPLNGASGEQKRDAKLKRNPTFSRLLHAIAKE